MIKDATPAPSWKLVGSTGSLESLAELIRKNWYWSVCEFDPTDDPKVWSVRSGNGPSATTRVRLAGKRYRFESLVGGR